MKLLAFLIAFSVSSLMAETVKYTCPAPQDIKANAMPTIHHVASNWKGNASLSKVRWFFNGTEEVAQDKNGKAVLKCNYGNRGNKLTLEMPTSHKVSACSQETCERATGKGSAKRMLESCTYSCTQ